MASYAKSVASSKTGTTGEALARDYLLSKGYKHITSNWSCKLGEIDLIMQNKDVRVFVEVRTRHKTAFGEALETVGPQKQAKLIRTALYYQQRCNYWNAIRFDVIGIDIDPATKAPTITHIQDAF